MKLRFCLLCRRCLALRLALFLALFFASFLASLFAVGAWAEGHGPLFGLATPTNSKGEWSFDSGLFWRASDFGSQASLRGLIGYGFTPHVSLFVTAPAVTAAFQLAPTRIQPGSDFDATVRWRFQHRATKVGTRIESTLFAGVAVPGPRSAFQGLVMQNGTTAALDSHAPGTMFGAVTGMASRSHYVWLGGTFTKFYERDGSKRPDLLDYSLVYGYRPPKWRRSPDKWDWRLFAELVGEHSDRFLTGGAAVPETQAHQIFLGPTVLGIYRNYTIGFGAQAAIYHSVGLQFPHERARFAVNFSYLLFQHKH